ncbi:hypothetical protein SAMN05421823_1142 [Catalinimonas alkaloidigena]|uniref:Uncharacterized protein n=1 Tax=Catalinimonas alkaloidigena TaxID=1075417 RepID=A0A1G9TF88_9BACT|nr:hypothetical protein [Catalinimonas alkaloidigena]SDM46411.1 hypothetical protein SAMN05421823_1142 [Catalinimonas alkaloidigena]
MCLKIKSLFLVPGFVLLSCGDDTPNELPEPVATSLITIAATEHFSGDNLEHWVVVSDKKGEVLASAELTNDTTLTTTQSVEGWVNITLVAANQAFDQYQLTTYTQVPVDQTWRIPDPTRVGYEGLTSKEATIKIEDAPQFSGRNFFNWSMSNAHGLVDTGGRSGGGKVDVNVRVHEQAPQDMLLVLHDGTFTPRYKWFAHDLFTGNNPVLDFEQDFAPIDQVVELSFDQVQHMYMELTAFQEETLSSYQGLDGYVLAQILLQEPESPSLFKVGYVEGFDLYRTYWSATLADKNYVYEKFGGPPPSLSIELFQGDFSVMNSAYATFQFTATEEFDVLVGAWSNDQDVTRWSIHYPRDNAENLVLQTLPAAFGTRYPTLTLSGLSYKGCVGKNLLDRDGYPAFLDYVHHNEKKNQLMELYSVSNLP